MDPLSQSDPQPASASAGSGSGSDPIGPPAPDASQSPPPAPAARSSAAGQALDTVQTVITALILAFMFRAFFIEAFIIPTGSMAHSLLGEHGTLVCPSCGWEFDFGPANVGGGEPPFRGGLIVRCPNCHETTELDESQIQAKAGDRILVHKWPYVLGRWLGPHRWDVIVFRDPADPAQNFIKRLIALPGEAIEIIDGDVYIRAPGESEFHIARKPAAAQQVLWFVVFDQSRLPAPTPSEPHPSPWVCEPADTQETWRDLDSRELHFSAHDQTPHAIRFAPLGSHLYFRDIYAYNRGASPAFEGTGTLIGDVRVSAELDFQQPGGQFAMELERDGVRHELTIHADGSVQYRMIDASDQRELLALPGRSPVSLGQPTGVEFGHLDQRVYARIAGCEVLSTSDRDYAPDLAKLRSTRRVAPVGVRLSAAAARLALRSLRIDRDVYYTRTPGTLRGNAGNPFELGPREYFVLGDNSPGSHDSREWTRGPSHLSPEQRDEYRLGTVPEDQIVGRAFFVYLPGLLPLGDGRWRLPDIGRMRFVR